MEESSSNVWKTLWEKEKLLVTSNFSFSYSVFKSLVMQTRKNQGLFGKGLKKAEWNHHKESVRLIKKTISSRSNCWCVLILPCLYSISGVRGCEVERRPRSHEVPSSIHGRGFQLSDFFICPHIWPEYWCSSQEAESREISISCKNLFLNRCKINMFKLF